MEVMLTKDDVGLLVDNFVTKAEFNQKIDHITENMVTKDDHRKVLGLVESVYTEVKKMREEQSSHFNEHRRINDDLQSHHKRITALERPVSISHRIKK